MQKNPQTPKIILFHSKDTKIDSGKQYLVITDKAGEQHKISEKRQTLWGIFQNAHDAEPFLLIYEEYNHISYVADAKPLADDLLKLAIQDMGLRATDAQTEEKNRSTSLSYAKDMLVGGKIELKDLFTQAQKNYEFIKRGYGG